MKFNTSNHKICLGLAGLFCGVALLFLQAPAAQAAGSTLPYTANTTLGPAPLTVQFNSATNDSYGNLVTNWFWNFGDGGTNTAQNPSHIYTNSGTYIPTLTGIDITGTVTVGIGPSITVGQLPNLVLNGGFETGDFTGWTLTGDTFDMDVSANSLYVNSGGFGAQLGPKTGTLSQTLTTGPGTNYLISFWLDSPTNGIPPNNQFSVSWNGQTLMSLTNIGPIGWTNVTLAVTATQTNTVLQFGIQNPPSYFGLDDVFVGIPVVAPASQTAECSSTATFSMASNTSVSAIIYLWYDIQGGSTNLVQAGTNTVLTITNVSSATPTNYIVVLSNASGSFTSAVVSLTVVDTTPPVITLNGSNVMTVLINSAFVDPGATANDACAGALLPVNTNGTVNPNVLGTNTITYTATDGVNSVTNTRTVKVVARTYDNLVLTTSNVLGYWPFTLASQANSVINGYTGTFSNAAMISPPGSGPTFVNVSNNTAVILNGSGSYVDTTLVGGITNIGTNVPQGSIVGWFNLANLPSVAGHPFVIAGESQPTNDFTVQIGTNNQIQFFSGNSTNQVTVATNALTLNTWHFIAVTFIVNFFSTQACNIYLDGVPVATNTVFSPHPAVNSTFAIGASDTVPSEYFQGALADIAIFNYQLTGAEVANFYAAATMPLSVNISSPTNGNSFTTNQSITFSASASAVNGLQSLALYTNSVLLTNVNTANVSVVLSNLPPGSYALDAVATDDTLFSTNAPLVHVTVNVPGTTLIDFDIPDASAGPVSGANLANYLSLYGVTVGSVTGNTNSLAIQEDQNILNGSITASFSKPNLLTQTGTNGAVSYTLVFNQPYTSVSWERTALLASSGGVVSPAWTAYAFNGANEISQIGERQILSPTNIPAKLFTLYGSSITSITFTGNNTLGALATLPSDSMLLSVNALTNPLPSITLTTNNFVAGEPGGINLTANASESGGAISRIDFYENQNLVGDPVTVVAGTNASASLSVTSLAPGSYTFYAVATDANGVVSVSATVTIVVTSVPGVAVINFDDPIALPTSLGAVGGTNLSNYLASFTGFGITISNATLGTRLEAINQSSFSGNELPLPSSLPNLFTQVGSSHAVTFSLAFTNQTLQSVTFTRAALLTNGPSGITHPAWTARILDASGDELESVSEPVLFSTNNIQPRTFALVGNNIASVRFDSDSQQTAAFAAVLLDDLVLNTNAAVNPLTITLNPPGGSPTSPASIPLGVTVPPTNIDHVEFYSGPTLIGSSSNSPFSFTWTNVLNGTFNLTAKVFDSNGFARLSAPISVLVAPGAPGTPLKVDFDSPSLNATVGPVTLTNLAPYLATNGGITVVSNTPGGGVVVENETNVAGGGFVSLSSVPNLLTEIGSNGPLSFTVSFTNLLTQFSFTRPALVANPSVTHPAWQAVAFDALGVPLGLVQEPVITGFTNVPAQTYTLTGGSIASVEFDSAGTGLATFNAGLFDDFVLTFGNSSTLAPSVVITNPSPGQVFVAGAAIPISAITAPGTGTVTGVGFYFGGTNLAGSAPASPFSIAWNAPSNGSYALTAIVTNNSGLLNTSAPVTITVSGTGFAITTPPLTQTIGVGSTNVLSVSTTGTNVSYQWQTNGGAIPGATLDTYTINNAQLSDAGSYTVVASSHGISITSQPPAIITVLSPPTISSPPASPAVINVGVNIGSNVTLSVTASDVVGTNSIPFYYQWLLNGASIPGATNSSFTISNAQPINSGNYRALVANIAASQLSPTFAVLVNFGGNAATTNNVTFASSIPFDPLVGPVSADNSSSPAIPGPSEPTNAIAGKPAGSFLWYNWTAGFTGVVSLTTQGSSFDTLLAVFTGNSATNLTVVAQDDDSGGYFTSLLSFNCVQGVTYYFAVAGFKGATGSVILGLPSGTGYRVLDPASGDAVPVITQQPSNQIVNIGDTVTLSVSGFNAASYQWFFANAPVVGISATTVINTNTLLSTNTLIISNFPAGAVGNYYALVANSVGAVQSAVAAIEIATQTNGTTSNTPVKLTVDKFGDAVDLTAIGTASRYRPEALGGDVGGFTLSQSFSTAGATKEEGEPNHAGQPGGASYWYSYTANAGGTLHFDTAGSTFNTILAVYTGDGKSFSTLHNVGAAFTTNYVKDGQPVVLVSNVVAGKYFIAIDGYLGASGSAHLNVIPNQSTPPVNTNVPPITNNFHSFAMSFPPNNYLTTSSNVIIKGTVKGIVGVHDPVVSFVQASINANSFGHANLTATNFAAVLAPGPNGIEEAVAQESVSWSSNVVLVPGANVITAQSVSVGANGTADDSIPITRTVFYVSALPSPSVKSTLTLATSGNGKITGLASQASLEINKVYHVTAVPSGNWLFTNWSSGPSLTNLSPLPNGPSLFFVMSNNLTLQANFVTNPFTAVAGVYNGLFYPASGVTEESSGFITVTVPASSRGAFTGKLLLDGGAYPFSSTFDLAGDAEQTILRGSKTPVTVELHANLNLPMADGQLTGIVINEDTNSWVSDIMAERADFNARNNPATSFAGKYTVVIPPGPNAPTNQPGGYGYATLVNNLAGHVVISGRLGDGTTINQAVSVSTNGDIPLYASLYSSKGSLLGWLTLTDNPSNSPAQSIMGNNLSWIKPPGRAGTLYSGGFTNPNITVIGSVYVSPLAGANFLTLTNSTLTMTFSNGDIPGGAVTYSNLTISGNKLVNPGPGILSGSIAPATGILTVTFRPPGANANITARGVVLQDDSPDNGAGWFLGTDQSGSFLLQQ